MAEMLMQMVYAIDENPDQDFLGELYMACNLGNDHAGQFFTPYNVCQCMSEIIYDVPALLDGKGFIAVNDPACGAGALLLSFANICKRKGINYQEKVLFVAQDIDYTVGLMCYIQLSLMGCAGYVVIGDTLINPCTAYDKKGLLPAGDPEAVWHQEDYDRLAEGIKSGESYMSISKALGKSEKAIRGKVYYCYLTENADKVRAMMAGGNWGDGAPEPTVWQARLFSRSRAEMQTTMTMLVEALNCRIRQVGYDPALEDHWNQYWQRTTCLHWDDLKHCTAGCTDCDSCAEYKKIPPQYCARCGATFYERKENTFCLQCRFDRKKQAQRHWCRVNAKRGERP